MHTISFEVNNKRKLTLVQDEHDGDTRIVTIGADGRPEDPDGWATVISPGEFVLLIDYFRNCKRESGDIL